MDRKSTTKKMDATIRAIAARYLDIETLETRRMDSLDFHEVSVWGLKAALEAAYNAGRNATTTNHGE